MEIELKFLISQENKPQLLQLLNNLQIELLETSHKHLANSYYDTPEQTLRAWDFGLRTRAVINEGKVERAEQTIKLAGQDIGGLMRRPEHNVEIKSESVFADLTLFDNDIWPADFPIQDTQLKLQRTFTTEFDRTMWLFRLDNGAIVECVYDQGQVIVEDGDETRTQAISELELELKQGVTEDLFQLGFAISRQIPCQLGTLSKAARGYQLAANSQLKRKNLQPVVMTPDSTLEQGFESILSYAIKFLQHHELVFQQQQNAKSLRRIIDAVSLIINTFEVFSELIVGATRDKLLTQLKLLRKEKSWVEMAYQLEKLQGRKSPYRADIESNPDLIELSNLSVSSEQISETLAYLQSPAHNNLMLTLLQWLSTKRWRNEMDLSLVSNLQRSVVAIAGDSIETSWQFALENLTEFNRQKDAYDLALLQRCHWSIVSCLLMGVSFSELYDEDSKESYRAQLLNILIGLEEAILLDKLPKKLQQAENAPGLMKWLADKKTSLNMALIPSMNSAVKLKRYW